MFYIRDYGFERNAIGGVIIQDPKGNRVNLSIEDWCSLIASVSLKGDTRESFDKAFKFHTEG